MRVKMNTLSQVINKQNPAIPLPRSSIHDAYILDFEIKIKNTGASAVTPTITELLTAIENISVVSDSSQVHYSLGGIDLARRNSMFCAAATDDIMKKTFTSLAANAETTVKFPLFLDEGDIIAIMHDNLEMKVTFLSKISANVTIESAVVKTTIIERIPTSAAELVATYGENFEYAAEPKVYLAKQTVAANSEFTGFFDMPTGTLLTGAMIHFSAAPEKVGIMQIVPDRVELQKVDWDVLRAIDQRKHKTDLPENVVTLEYGTQWMENGIGKAGWHYNKGDIQIAVKTEEEITMRYVSFERLVNTSVYDKTGVVNVGGKFV